MQTTSVTCTAWALHIAGAPLGCTTFPDARWWMVSSALNPAALRVEACWKTCACFVPLSSSLPNWGHALPTSPKR